MIRPLLVLVAGWSCSVAASAAQALDDLVASHPVSLPRAVTGTPEGDVLFVAEGGVLTTLWTRGGIDDPSSLLGRTALGRVGVVPAELVADVLATRSDKTTWKILVAGGISGLWVADANPYVRHAARVDDRATRDVPAQDSDRACTAVAQVVLDGEDWVVALFAAKGDNRLRFYRRSDVLGCLGLASAEGFGAEVEAAFEVELGEHPVPLDPGVRRGGHAYGLALDVLPTRHADGHETADVFVACGAHGVVRVRADLADPAPFVVRWGPRFGTGTTYHDPGPPAPLVPAYADTIWSERRNHHALPPLPTRIEPPIFTDVDVHRTMDGDVHLYAAIDMHNWARFDVTRAWGVDLPIDHHELGTLDPPFGVTSWGLPALRSFAHSDRRRPASFARRIHVQDVPGRDPLVVVTSGMTPFWMQSAPRAPGRVFNDSWSQLDAFPIGITDSLSRGVWTVVVDTAQVTPNGGDLSAGPSASRAVGTGGWEIFVPRSQRSMGGPRHVPVGEWIEVFTTGDDQSTGRPRFGTTAQVVVGLERSPTLLPRALVRVRTTEQAPGRLTSGVVPSIVDGRVLLTARNDGQIAQDGILVLDDTDPTNVTFLRRGSADGDPFEGGSWIDDHCQWDPDPADRSAYAFGEGNEGLPGRGHWKLVRTDLPDDPRDPAAVFGESIWLLDMPRDVWGARGRDLYVAGHVDDAYDAAMQAAGIDGSWIFATRMTPDGLLMFRRDVLIDHVDPDGDAVIRPTRVDPLEAPGIHMVEFRTHPEFGGFPAGNPRVEAFWQNAPGAAVSARSDLTDGLTTFTPRVVPLYSDPTVREPNRWLLAVPCGQVACPDDLEIYEPPGDPAWAPTGPYAPGAANSRFQYAMLRFWDVTNPLSFRPMDVTLGPGGDVEGVVHTPHDSNLSFPATSTGTGDYFGAGAEGLFWRVEPVHHAASKRTFVVTADMGRSELHLVEVTRMLHDVSPAPPLQVDLLSLGRSAPGAAMDDLVSNIRCMAVDAEPGGVVRVYCGMQRGGILPVRIDFAENGQPTFVLEPRIETTAPVWWIHVQRKPDGGQRLLVSAANAGIQVYE